MEEAVFQVNRFEFYGKIKKLKEGLSGKVMVNCPMMIAAQCC